MEKFNTILDKLDENIKNMFKFNIKEGMVMMVEGQSRAPKVIVEKIAQIQLKYF